jgi:flagellar biosynthesis/type III secretory pathway chaperone
MQAHFSEMVELLQAEAGICCHLLKAIERERRAMLGAQLQPLKAATLEKEALALRLQAVERRREEWVGRLAEQLGCAAAELTLRRLTQIAPTEAAAQLADCRRELAELVERLQMENRRSAAMTSQSLAWLQSFYSVIKGLAGKGPVYQPGGQMQAALLQGKLISQST